MTYRTFLRSDRNFKEFSRNPKIEVDTGLTEQEARAACREYNEHRTAAEIEAGTKMEFDREE
jgi:hypothetical protein